MTDESHYEVVCPLWIDVDTYSDRDRLIFVCGVEFGDLIHNVRFDDDAVETTIHRENESRVRLLCGRFGRACTITPCEAEVDPEGVWSYLTIEAKEQGEES